MTEREAFIRAICEQPGEDTHRLVYADWLEEHSTFEPDLNRAEFIRSQCADMRYLVREHQLMCMGHGNPVNWVRWCFCVHIDEFGTPCRGDERGGMSVYPCPPSLAPSGEPLWVEVPCPTGQIRQSFSKGFVYHVRLNLRSFMSHARTLFTNHPITSVTLMDRLPSRQGVETYEWLTHANVPCPETPDSALPPEFRHFMPNQRKKRPQHARGVRRFSFRSEEKAREALDKCCVGYGRWLVGLPPLKLEPTLMGQAT